jgi:hypothetical protein
MDVIKLATPQQPSSYSPPSVEGAEDKDECYGSSPEHSRGQTDYQPPSVEEVVDEGYIAAVNTES